MGAMNEIFGYLIQTALSLYMVAMLLRFLLQLVARISTTRSASSW